jgi:hypothetical protein
VEQPPADAKDAEQGEGKEEELQRELAAASAGAAQKPHGTRQQVIGRAGPGFTLDRDRRELLGR